jgi:hypothetical protein
MRREERRLDMTLRKHHPQTALGAALASHGITADIVQLDLDLARALNHGISVETIFARAALLAERSGYTVVYEIEENRDQGSVATKAMVDVSLPAEGHSSGADEATNSLPSAGSDAGQPSVAEKATRPVPAPAEGQKSEADKARLAVPSAGPSPDYIRASIAEKAGNARRLTVFDAVMLSDGTPIGDVRPSELPRRARQGRFDAHLCEALMEIGQWPTDSVMRVLISGRRLEAIVEQARKDAFWHDH